MGARKKFPKVTPRVIEHCVQLIRTTAKKHGVRPLSIMSYERGRKVDAARREVMCRMIVDFAMARHQVAAALGRDVRRVRKSVLGV